jgi:PAS domain-containing protein
MRSARYIRSMGSGGRAFYSVDLELRFLTVNETALGLWGKTAPEVIGRTLAEAFPKAVGSAPYEAHIQALRSFRPIRGRFSSPVLGEDIDLEIWPNATGLQVSFTRARSLPQA